MKMANITCFKGTLQTTENFAVFQDNPFFMNIEGDALVPVNKNVHR